jgi:hypothetical protein
MVIAGSGCNPEAVRCAYQKDGVHVLLEMMLCWLVQFANQGQTRTPEFEMASASIAPLG